VAVNSVTSIMLNKIDILSGLDDVLICMAYEVDGTRVDWWPSDADVLARAKPIYERFPGWAEPLHDCRTMGDLPENARRYVDAVERLSGAPICFVSVGPERHQTIERMPRPQRPKPLSAAMPAGSSRAAPSAAAAADR
jgi:adenylosuccinate synthase